MKDVSSIHAVDGEVHIIGRVVGVIRRILAGGMRTKLLLATMFLFAAACGNPAKDAEAEYALVEKSGSYGDICRAAGKVMNAWLEKRDTAKYEEWRLTRDVQCNQVGICAAHPGACEARRL